MVGSRAQRTVGAAWGWAGSGQSREVICWPGGLFLLERGNLTPSAQASRSESSDHTCSGSLWLPPCLWPSKFAGTRAQAPKAVGSQFLACFCPAGDTGLCNLTLTLGIQNLSWTSTWPDLLLSACARVLGPLTEFSGHLSPSHPSPQPAHSPSPLPSPTPCRWGHGSAATGTCSSPPPQAAGYSSSRSAVWPPPLGRS